MVSLKQKKIGDQNYYYLGHTSREGRITRKKEIYLGREIPKNLDEIKRKFLFEIYQEKWYKQFDLIKSNYSKELSKMPQIAREKETETFMIRFTYNTQRIEGSTLTLRETADLLEHGITPAGKPMRDVKETEAHRKVFYEMLNYKKELTLLITLIWHRKMFEETKERIAGKIRDHQVAISGSRYLPPSPLEVHFLLREFYDWYHRNKEKTHPVTLAALVHLKFVAIHPFSDGNGRTSRLLMNYVLHKYKFPLLDIAYEKRAGYYTALERAHLKKDDNIFVQWFFKKYLKENKRFLKS